MRNPLVWSVLALATVLVLSSVASVPIAARVSQDPEYDADGGGTGRRGAPRSAIGPVPRLKDWRPDMRGRWASPVFTASNILEEHPGGFGIQAGKSVIIDPPDGKIPYQPWALARRDENRRPENAYLDNGGRCVLVSAPRIMLFEFDVAYTPDAVVLTYTHNHITRVVSMDKRHHLAESIRLYMGDPVGHWEGDTLVIDSTNFNGKGWLALGGDFFTDNAHLVERLTMTDANTLKYTVTITDSKAFARPWTVTTAAPIVRQPEEEEMLEDPCHEGNAALVHLKNVYDAAHRTANK